MPRYWHFIAVAMLAGIAAAPSRHAVAEEYGRRIDAVPSTASRVATSPARPTLHSQRGAEQQLVQDQRSRRALRQSKPQESNARSGSLKERILGITGGKPISTVFAGLAIAIGTFLLLAWVLRRGMPKRAGRLPKEVVELLGHAPLAGKQAVQLVRLGNKLLLISLTPSGAETLSEVTDPNEVTRIVGLCESTKGGSASVAFRQVFEDLAKA